MARKLDRVRLLELLRSSSLVAALAYTAAFAVLAAGPLRGSVRSLEGGIYDWILTLAPERPAENVAVVAIDEESVAALGAWPWPRPLLARLLETLSSGGATRLVPVFDLSRPTIDINAAAVPGEAAQPTADDALLVEAIGRAGNVVLPAFKASVEHPPAATWAGLPAASVLPPAQFPEVGLMPPLEIFAGAASGTGHALRQLDSDGEERHASLFVQTGDRLVPALALGAVRPGEALGSERISLAGHRLTLGATEIPLSPDGSWLPRRYPSRGGKPAFPQDPAAAVLDGRTPPDKYAGRIVLIGVTAADAANTVAAPEQRVDPLVVGLARQVSSLLQQDWLIRPPWARTAELVLLLGLFLYLAFGVPRLTPAPGWIVTVTLTALFIATELTFLLLRSTWLQLGIPTVFLLGGHLVLALEGLAGRRGRHSAEQSERLESSKMLGLAYQQQGQLDLAFECLRMLEADDDLLRSLYELGLEAERRRKFDLAVEIYEHIAQFDPEYQDLPARRQFTRRLGDTLTLGERGPKARAPICVDNSGRHALPMLGHYRIVEELGRGAMGVIYLARDTRTEAIVAIKAFSLADEFEEGELAGISERLSREAESASRLNHPDIVRVFEAGQESGLAYIAMEYVDAKRMSEFTEVDSLLPAATVLEVIARAADALHYAHGRGVIHRDIKPANLLYNPVSGVFKITDLGVARLSDTRRTRTGIVLGTPSFMSPEQLAGEIVTGPSDLFSLGVTLYQLLTGLLPFRADTMPKLMFKVANEPHHPIRLLRPDLPVAVERFMARALQKAPGDRFPNGASMAAALRDAAREMGADEH